MDIREWLQNTADREPPDEYHHPGFPAFLRPQPSEVIDGVRPSRHRPKRNRASSDPIDTAHQQARRKQHQAVLHSSSSEHVRLAQNKDITTSHSRDSSVSGRALAPIKSYERRARHKTRPDRYDCQPKNERKDRETYREKKRKSKRRKSHRSGDGERTVGLVQSFQLKNGPKNERLTLRTGGGAGIFKHGRASAPMATSGPGLPDLVFNEMKFLQRPREHQDELPQKDPSTKKTTRSQRGIRDQEVSAYFKRPKVDGETEKRPSHVVKSKHDPNARAKLSQGARDGEKEAHTVDAPAGAFLGFGSRGPQPDAPAVRNTSGTNYTWSESIPARPLPALPPRSANMARSRTSTLQKHANTLESDSLAQRSTNARRTRTSRSRQTSDDVQRRQHPRVDDVESSQSLPQAHSVLADRIHAGTGSVAGVEHYQTSDILKLRQDNDFQHSSPSLLAPRQESVGANKENDEPRTTTPTSTFLRNAFEAVHKSYNDSHAELGNSQKHDGSQFSPGNCIADSVNKSTFIDDFPAPLNPTSFAEQHSYPLLPSPRFQIPQRGFSRGSKSTHTQHGRLPLRVLPGAPSQQTPGWQPSPLNGQVSTNTFDRSNAGDGMLELLPERICHPDRTCISMNAQQAEDLVRRLDADEIALPYNHEPEMFESQLNDIGHEEDGVWHEVADDTTSMPLYPSVTGLREDEEVNDLPAFWKPNKLY